MTVFEIDPNFANATRETVEKNCTLDTLERLTVIQVNFLDYGTCQTDFAFLDLEPKSDYFRAFAALDIPIGGIVCAHDLTHDPEPVGALLKALLENGYEAIGFPQERGLIVARRVA